MNEPRRNSNRAEPAAANVRIHKQYDKNITSVYIWIYVVCKSNPYPPPSPLTLPCPCQGKRLIVSMANCNPSYPVFPFTKIYNDLGSALKASQTSSRLLKPKELEGVVPKITTVPPLFGAQFINLLQSLCGSLSNRLNRSRSRAAVDRPVSAMINLPQFWSSHWYPNHGLVGSFTSETLLNWGHHPIGRVERLKNDAIH